MNTHIENARVPTDSTDTHSTLFPLTPFSRQPATPRDLCRTIGLNWMSAVKLFEGGWLSFDPAAVAQLHPAQEAELNFLGRLVAGGCDEGLLRQLLGGLQKPYAYRLDGIFFDWETRTWVLRPGGPERDVQFDSWLEELVETGQMRTLESLRANVTRAIADLRRLSTW